MIGRQDNMLGDGIAYIPDDDLKDDLREGGEQLERSGYPRPIMGQIPFYDDDYYVPKSGRTVTQILRDHRKYLGPYAPVHPGFLSSQLTLIAEASWLRTSVFPSFLLLS